MIPRDDVLRMAREAGWNLVSLSNRTPLPRTVEELERYAALDAAAEREACAKVCDDVESDRWDCYKGRGDHERFSTGRASPVVEGAAEGASLCAAAIRARAGGA